MALKTLPLVRGWKLPRYPTGPFTINRNSNQANGLVAWWPTSADDGLVLRDKSGYGYDGASAGIKFGTLPDRGAMLRWTKQTNEFISIASTPRIYELPVFSVSCWYQVDSYSAVHNLINLSNSTFQANLYGWTIYFAYGDITFRVSNGSTICSSYHSPASANTLFHVVCTYDSTYARFYLNAKEGNFSPASLAGPRNIVNAPLRIGADPAGSPDLSGYLDDIRIYNRALSAAEVYQLYDPATRWELYKPTMPVWVVAVQVSGDEPTTRTATHTTSATLKKEATAAHSTSAVLKQAGSASHITSAGIKKTQTGTVIASATLEKTETATTVTSATLKKAASATHLTGAILSQADSATCVTSATLLKTQTATVVTSATLEKTGTTTHTTSATLEKTQSATHIASAYLSTAGVKQHTTSAILKATDTASHIASAQLKTTDTATHLTGAVLKKAATGTTVTSATLKATDTAVHLTSAGLKKAATASHLANAILKVTSTASHTTDATLTSSGTVTRTHVTSAILKAAGTASHSCNGILSSESTLVGAIALTGQWADPVALTGQWFDPVNLRGSL